MITVPALQDFKNEMNHFFDRSLLSHFFNKNSFLESDLCPDVDIVESDNHYKLQANLPGIDKKNVEISFNNGLLNIKGKLESKKEEETENYIQCERRFGNFSRTFSFSDVHENAKIEAEFKNGVLNMIIPKSKSTAIRHIEIQ